MTDRLAPLAAADLSVLIAPIDQHNAESARNGMRPERTCKVAAAGARCSRSTAPARSAVSRSVSPAALVSVIAWRSPSAQARSLLSRSISPARRMWTKGRNQGDQREDAASASRLFSLSSALRTVSS
jgi:hypothetical protein